MTAVLVTLPNDVVFQFIRGDKNKQPPRVTKHEIVKRIHNFLRDTYKDLILTMDNVWDLFSAVLDTLLMQGKVKLDKSIVGRNEHIHLLAVD